MDFCDDCVFPAVTPPTSQDSLSSVSKVAPPLFGNCGHPLVFSSPQSGRRNSSLPSINGRLVGRYGLHASAAVGPCSARRWQPRFVGGNGSRLCDARQSQRCASTSCLPDLISLQAPGDARVITVGRHRLNEVQLDCPRVPSLLSRQHAEIVCDADGLHSVTDKNTLNGDVFEREPHTRRALPSATWRYYRFRRPRERAEGEQDAKKLLQVRVSSPAHRGTVAGSSQSPGARKRRASARSQGV